MPTDVVEIRGRGRDARWFLKNADRDFSEAALYTGPWGTLSPGEIVEELDVEYDVEQGRIVNVRRYAPLPASVRTRLCRAGCDHVGLALDKFVYRYSGQELSLASLRQVVAVNNRLAQDRAFLDETFAGALDRQRACLTQGKAAPLRAKTLAPLSLHLARASALENAGICLHAIYGFAYLPGTGLKGMARAFAETVWLPAQQDAVAAWRQIEDVFGWAPNPDRARQIKDPAHPARRRRIDNADRRSPEISASTGAVVFHDAWPTAWPKLTVDIVNNHHPSYYGGNANTDDSAPGDWDDPRPVYFLSVERGAEFEFWLTKRRDDVSNDLLDLARQWLAGALTELGAGAKTAAGYGAFQVTSSALEVSQPAVPRSTREEFTTTLELVTPAFLAGANQDKDDCDLRGATLRGQLRWWWRTLHAGFVDIAALRQMEAAIWGDAKHGSPLSLVVSPAATQEAVERPGKRLVHRRGRDELVNDEAFLQRNGITTQGLFYAAYGTDELVRDGGRHRRKRRWCLSEGSAWSLRIDAKTKHVELVRDRQLIRHAFAPTALLEQCLAALWLFCQFGGAGAKARKGFGSFATPANLNNWDLSRAERVAQEFRHQWQNTGLPFASGKTGTACLQAAQFIEQPTPWKNPWTAINQLGDWMQEFAQAPPDTKHGKHCPGKIALGLPRNIHGPRRTPLDRQDPVRHQPPLPLRGPRGTRHASPICYHFARDNNRKLLFRATVFTTDSLWDATKPEAIGRAEADAVLTSLVAHLRQRLATLPSGSATEGGSAVANPDWEKLAATYIKRLSHTAHLIQLPDGLKVRVEHGRLPAPTPVPNQTVPVYRQSSGARQCRWEPPPPGAG